MSQFPSIISLHLRYRLRIAEMNCDINVLRIFDDYLNELKSKRNEPEVTAKIEEFSKRFIDVRKEIDELRDAMHIVKMELAAMSRENRTLDAGTYEKENLEELKEKYFAFRQSFEKLKDEFINFESEW
jgi:archaellum component FlaC